MDPRERMDEYSFATDKESDGLVGHDSKGAKDEDDWVRLQEAREAGMPPLLGVCKYNLTNPASPCFLRSSWGEHDPPLSIK